MNTGIKFLFSMRWMVVMMLLAGNLGCGALKLDVTSNQVEYANPSYKHVRDLPINRYDKKDGKPERAKEESLSAADYEQAGDLMLSKGNCYLAFMKYEKALAVMPGNIVLEFKRALTYLSAHKNEEALKGFRLVVEKQPDFAMAYEGIGIASFRLHKFNESETAFKKALALDPSSWKSHNFLGAVFDARNEHQKAVQSYKAALRIKPMVGFIYNNLGVSYSQTGAYHNAVQAFNRAIQLGYTPEKIYNNLGLAWVRLDRYGQALDNFRKGGTEAQAYNNLGCGYLSRKKYREAISCFEKAVCLDSSYYVVAGDNLTKAKRFVSSDTIP